MATLDSSDGKSHLELMPYAFESAGEDWVLTHVRFRGPLIVHETTGGFLNLGEWVGFVAALDALGAGRIGHYVLDPMEPELNVMIDGDAHMDLYTVQVLHRQYEMSTTAQRGTTPTHTLTVVTNREKLRSFARALRQELDRLTSLRDQSENQI